MVQDRRGDHLKHSIVKMDRPSTTFIMKSPIDALAGNVLRPGQECAFRIEQRGGFAPATLLPLVSSMRRDLGDDKLQPGVTIGLEFTPSGWRLYDIYMWGENRGSSSDMKLTSPMFRSGVVMQKVLLATLT